MKPKGSTPHETLGNYLGGLFVAFLLTILCVVGIVPNRANGALRAVAGGSGSAVVPVATCSTAGGIIYSSAGAFTCNPSIVTTTGGNVVVSSGALVASVPAIDVAQTWNNGAVAFTAAKINVTNTASATGSTLLDLQVAGASKFNVNANGVVVINPVGGTGYGSFGPAVSLQVSNGSSEVLRLSTSTANSFLSTGDGLNIVTGHLGFGSIGSPDIAIQRSAVNTLEVNNGTAGTFASIVAANYVGTTTNNNAAAGAIGEYITSSVASSGAIVMNSGTPITTVSTGATVTAGDYDVQGTACYSTAIATSITVLEQGISTSNNTFSTLGSYTSDQFAAMVPLATGTNEICRSTPTVRISLSGTSTVFLVTRGVFTVSTLSSYGFLRLRRVR